MNIREWIIQYIKAFRLLSLTLALGAVGLGMAAGFLPDADREYRSDAAFFLRVFLVTIAGLASQAGANLINDFFDGDFKYRDPSTRRLRFLGRNRSIFAALALIPLALRARRTVAGFRGAGIPWTNALHLGLLIITFGSVFL